MKKCPKLQDRTADQIASFLIKKYNEQGIMETIRYFKQQGFTAKSLTSNSNDLFKFLVLIAYDRRPFNPYEIIWEKDDPKSVFSVLDSKGLLDLNKIRKISEHALNAKLKQCIVRKNLRLHDIKKSGRGIRFAKVMKEIALRIDQIMLRLSTIKSSSDVESLHREIDDIYGFGPTISTKVIMYLIRGMNIGKVPTSELGAIAKHFEGEWHNSKWCRRIENPSLGGRKGLLQEVEQRLKDDPMAIDYFFYLDRNYCSKRKCDVCGL